MIVLNPPPIPPFVSDLVSKCPAEAAVEWALRMARVKYACAGNADPVEWMRCLVRYGDCTTFVIEGNPSYSFAVYLEREVPASERKRHHIVDGYDGVIRLAAWVVGHR
jgi:hypothetical protein